MQTKTVYCNFSETPRELPVPTGRVLIGNYPLGEIQDVVLLRPYEALCFYDGIREIERLDE